MTCMCRRSSWSSSYSCNWRSKRRRSKRRSDYSSCNRRSCCCIILTFWLDYSFGGNFFYCCIYYPQYYIYFMITLKIILLMLFLVIILWFVVFAIVLVLWPLITWFKKAPYVPSFDYHLRVMKKHLKLETWSTIVDLWCGDGKALRFFSKEFWLKWIGYDLNPFVILYGKLIDRLFGYKHIKLIRSNFSKAQLARYDYVYVYLFPNQLIAIEDRMFENISKDCIIISNSFTFVKHEPFDIIHDGRGKKVIYLYRKKEL